MREQLFRIDGMKGHRTGPCELHKRIQNGRKPACFRVQDVQVSVRRGGESFAAAQFLFVKVHTNGTIIKCTVSGEYTDGILQNKPASGQNAEVDRDGVSKIKAGTGGIAVGDLVTPDANACAIVAADEDQAAGRCLVAAAAGAIGTVTLSRTQK